MSAYTNAHDVARDLFMDAHDDEPQKALTVRVPITVAAQIDALREHADVSKQYLLLQLVELGIQALMAAMPPEIAHEVEGDVLSHLQALQENS